ncbi:MAG TPA: TonB family protein [Terriglobales bacterium]|nr:TonB family protein [Terriglobales bacterium]
MAVSADIYTERDQFSKPVAVSIGLHVALFGSILLYATVMGRFRGEDWGGTGGGGGAMSATLVSSIPLPASPESTNILANESKGVSQSLPKAEEVPEPTAVPIPAPDAKKLDRTTRSTRQDRKPAQPVQTATNVIPFGQGGPISGPYGTFSAGGAKGGFGFNGGGGDFGSRYGWYVDVVRRKVSENWLKYEVDPNIRDARRVYITFEISRAGQPRNITIEQSSGVPSLDQSAVRALQRIDTFGPLPGDYHGSSVNVEFWFDYRR